MDPGNTANWTMASIGKYRVDINNGNIANPNDSEDFMSLHCGPRWISLYTHTFLINAAGLTPQVIPTGSGAAASRVIRNQSSTFERNEATVQPLVFLLGTIDVDGKVEVATVARLQTRYFVDVDDRPAMSPNCSTKTARSSPRTRCTPIHRKVAAQSPPTTARAQGKTRSRSCSRRCSTMSPPARRCAL